MKNLDFLIINKLLFFKTDETKWQIKYLKKLTAIYFFKYGEFLNKRL